MSPGARDRHFLRWRRWIGSSVVEVDAQLTWVGGSRERDRDRVAGQQVGTLQALRLPVVQTNSQVHGWFTLNHVDGDDRLATVAGHSELDMTLVLFDHIDGVTRMGFVTRRPLPAWPSWVFASYPSGPAQHSGS